MDFAHVFSFYLRSNILLRFFLAFFHLTVHFQNGTVASLRRYSVSSKFS